MSAACRAHLSEVARFERRTLDAGWAADLEAFLTDHGIRAGDLSSAGRAARAGAGPAVGAAPAGAGAARGGVGAGVPGGVGGRHGPVCGAAVLLSAAAGAALVGVRARGSPAPAVPEIAAVVYGPGDRAADPAPRGPWRVGPWEPSWPASGHAAAVAAVREAIGRGDVYQANVVGHASALYLGDPVPALARLGGVPGARYGGVLAGAGWAVGCASPETLVQVDGGTVRTRPIKGTRPATAAGRRELLASEKERAEHIMIVDLARNDLARVARVGSVRVERLFGLREWSGLWQAESEVAADLLPGTGLAALLAAVFPGGSVTGAPKLAALHEIYAVEPVGRGPSMGAFGWIGPDGDLDLGLTIRTAAATYDDCRLHVWAGGGITWGSDPDAEVAEAAAKAAPMMAAVSVAHDRRRGVPVSPTS